ncbi:MAG: TIGR02996 domain-containing protein [Myxococcaceae bacterium]
MPSVLAIISKKVFEQQAPGAELGQVLALDGYDSKQKRLEVLTTADALFLVTVRAPGERLWMAAILRKPRFTGSRWQCQVNASPLTDITPLIGKLKFDSGEGLAAKAGALGMSLQTPRILTAADVTLLEGAVEGAGGQAPRPVPAPRLRAKATKPVAKPEVPEQAIVTPPRAPPGKASSAEALGQVWREHGAKDAATAAAGAGLRLTAAQLEKLATALEKTNGTRQARLLEHSHVFEAIFASLGDPHGVGIVHGGEANQGEQRTSLCLAFHQAGSVTVGIGLSRARGAGPGVTWDELKPWSRDTEKNLPKLKKWARDGRDRAKFTVSARAAPAAGGREAAAEKALLQAVLAAPNEDGPRAVYSDRLTEQGDPRGEFIALQLSLARETPGTRAHADLAARAQALEKQHGVRWSKPVAQFTLKQWYRRGFIATVDMRVQAFVANGARLFELAPVEKVILRGLDSGALRKLAASPTLEKVEALGLAGDLRSADTQTLGQSPHLGRLRTLDVRDCGLIGRDHPSLAPILAACPKLEWLEVDELSDSIATAVQGFPNVRVRSTSKKFTSAAAKQLVAANRVVS